MTIIKSLNTIIILELSGSEFQIFAAWYCMLLSPYFDVLGLGKFRILCPLNE